MCHGPNAMSGGVIPDLRYLTPEKHKIFNGILAGAYASKGMPAMMDVLKPADADAIHQYLIQRAHDLQRSEERRVGKTGVSKCKSGWWADHSKKKTKAAK